MFWKIRALVATSLALGVLSLGAVPAAATTGSATQGTSVTVVGSLSVSLASPTLNAGSEHPSGSAPIGVGNITAQNTLGDQQVWSVTVQAQDMIQTGYSGSTCVSANGCISFLAQGFGVACSVSPSGPTVPAAVATGNSYASFSGTDTTPGTTYSSAVAILNGTNANQGTFTESGCVWYGGANSDQKLGSYTGNLQYTITG